MTTPADGLPWNAPARRCREYAIKKVLDEDDRREQITHMLADPTRTRQQVGEFCIYHLQFNALALRPWVTPPIRWHEDIRDETDACREMRALIATMKELGVSVAHPDPGRAVEQARAAAGPRAHGPGHI